MLQVFISSSHLDPPLLPHFTSFTPPLPPSDPLPGGLKRIFYSFLNLFFFFTLFCFSFHLRRHIHGERKFGGFSSNSLVVKKVEEATNQPKKKKKIVSTRGEVEDEEEEDHKKMWIWSKNVFGGRRGLTGVSHLTHFSSQFFLLWLFNLNFYAFYQLQSIEFNFISSLILPLNSILRSMIQLGCVNFLLGPFKFNFYAFYQL